MTSQTRQAAEDGITSACDGLSVPEALGALTEIMAQICADHGVMPGTDSFVGFLEILLSELPARINALSRESCTRATH